MPWLKSEGKAPKNDKLWELSDAAYRLNDAGRHYAVENFTDGHVPLSRISALTPKPATKPVVRELLKVRGQHPLWHELPEICEHCKELRARHRAGPLPRTGYVVHDFLEYNPSRVEWEEEQERRRRLSSAGGHARAAAIASRTAQPYGVPSGVPPGVPHGTAVQHSRTAGEKAPSDQPYGTPHGVPRTPSTEIPKVSVPRARAREAPLDPEPIEPDEPTSPRRPRGTGSVDPEVRREARPDREMRHVGEALRGGAR